MPDAPNCMKCGATLPANSPQGLCPQCLLQLGMASGSLSSAALAGSLTGESSSGMAATVSHEPEDKAQVDNASPENVLPEPGQRFGGYQIVRILGRGGMGAVYEAEQLETGRRVALKVLKHSLDSPEARRRFLREGRLAASINHPNSVYVFGTEEIDGTPAISMELVAGGTLQERVRQQGPLPVGEAVDIILQIIASLEAAQRLGVLHRDIKPANCFIDINGAVKVGDFGLSISTAPRGDYDVTHSNSFLGTPAFASPEQLRGDELNLRSDMYSVGVTLYYLLTGRTPFNADNMVKLLATVLERTAESPKKWRPEIPQGLGQVVLRCLEKQPTDRFKTYDELRQSLIPFSSAASTPAPLALRYLAAALDHFSWAIIMWLAIFLVPGFAFLNPFSRGAMQIDWQTVGYWLFTLSLYSLYIGIPEGLWGASLGKWLCRLRTVNAHREPPGIPKALVRVVIVALPPAIVSAVQLSVPQAVLHPFGFLFGVASLGCYAILFVTARQANGLAGVHDLLTMTRVIHRTAHYARTELPVSQDALPATQTATIGPYHVLDVFEKNNGDEWILGYDTRLLRRVWIHKLPPDAEQTPAALRNVARPGRLRWLNGKRSPTETWDAYEALTGEPLVKLLDRRWPWEAVRFWLLDLVRELAAADQDGSLPESLGPDRVWITADGQAKLLDFAAPGLDPLKTARQPNILESHEPLNRRRFLNQVSISALEGTTIDAAEATTRAARVPLPIAARKVLDQLIQPGNSDEVVARFESLSQQTPTVSRGRRFGLVSACCVPVLFLAAIGVMMFWLFSHFNQMEPDVVSLSTSLDVLDRLKSEKHEELNATPDDIRSMEIVIVHRYHKTITDPTGLTGPFAQGLFDEAKRRELERIQTAHPHPTSEEIKLAESNPVVQQLSEGMEMGQGFFSKVLSMMSIFMPLVGLSLVALASLLVALLFRRGPIMLALGVDIVTADGTLASRGRLLWRSVIAWSPLLLSPIVWALVDPLIQGDLSYGWLAVFPLAYLALVVCSLLLPDRGLQDRLAGTWLVPQ